MSVLKEELPAEKYLYSTNSPDAYRWYILGRNSFYLDRDYLTATKYLSKAIEIDSNYFSAISFLSIAYWNLAMYDQAKKWCLRAYEKRDQMPPYQQIYINWQYATYYETPVEAINCCKKLLEIDDQVAGVYYVMGFAYHQLYQYDRAISALEEALDIYSKWGTKPLWAFNYIELGLAYHETGQYRKEKRLYKKAEKDFPDDFAIPQRQAVLSFTEGDTVDANKYIEKHISLRKAHAASEADIATSLATIYSESGIMDKAEECYQQALSLEPDKPDRMNTFAYFLIEKDRNINKGLELIDKALELSPDNFRYLYTKGWGLYKQGKYEEALNLLEKSKETRPFYNHSFLLRLEAAKKAVAGQR